MTCAARHLSGGAMRRIECASVRCPLKAKLAEKIITLEQKQNDWRKPPARREKGVSGGVRRRPPLKGYWLHCAPANSARPSTPMCIGVPDGLRVRVRSEVSISKRENFVLLYGILLIYLARRALRVYGDFSREEFSECG